MKTVQDIRYCMTDGVPNEIVFCGRRNGKTQIIKEFLNDAKYKTDSDLVLGVARHCEAISKRGGEHSKEYHRIAQHLKKSAGHLKALERTTNDEKKLQTPSCLTNPERQAELLERYKEE